MQPQQQNKSQSTRRLVHIVTDTLNLKIDPKGATIVEARLEKYPVSIDRPDTKVRLLSHDPDDFFIAQSGLLSSDKERAPTHKAIFTSTASEYRMQEGEDSLVVEFAWTAQDGLKVIKRYTFQRGTHAFSLQQIVKNDSDKAWSGREYRQLQRGEPKVKKGPGMMYTFTGGAVYTPEDKYRKYKFDDLAEGEPNLDAKDGWVAMIQHYFLAAFVPPRGETEHFYGKSVTTNRYVLGTYTPVKTAAPGETVEFPDGRLWLAGVPGQAYSLDSGPDLCLCWQLGLDDHYLYHPDQTGLL